MNKNYTHFYEREYDAVAEKQNLNIIIVKMPFFRLIGKVGLDI